MRKMLLAVMVLCMSGLNVFAEVSSGQKAPDFSLTDTMGQQHSLSQHQGKYVVLEWLNPDCPFVKKQYDNSGNMPKLQKDYAAKDVVWLSINSSAEGKEGYYSGEELNAWAKKQNASPAAILLDSDGTVGRLYGAKTTPHMYIINPEGTLIYQGAIDSISSADHEDIAKAENYVQSTLDKAMAGQPITESATKAYGCSVKY